MRLWWSCDSCSHAVPVLREPSLNLTGLIDFHIHSKETTGRSNPPSLYRGDSWSSVQFESESAVTSIGSCAETPESSLFPSTRDESPLERGKGSSLPCLSLPFLQLCSFSSFTEGKSEQSSVKIAGGAQSVKEQQILKQQRPIHLSMFSLL